MIETEIRWPVQHTMPDHSLLGSSNDDLLKVKELSHKLQLSTKRRSVLQWEKAIKEGQFNHLLCTQSSEGNSLETIQEQHFRSDSTTGLHKDAATNKTESSALLQSGSAAPNKQLNSSKVESGKVCRNTLTADIQTKSNSTNLLNSPFSNRHSSVTLPDDNEVINDLNSSKCDPTSVAVSSKTESDMKERYRKITDSLENIRKDLIIMRMEDHSIARKLLTIREDLIRQRATQLCDEHAAMLDDFSWQLEEEEELNERLKMSDLSSVLVRPPDSLLWSSSPLRHIGLSKMSMDFKRFSVI